MEKPLLANKRPRGNEMMTFNDIVEILTVLNKTNLPPSNVELQTLRAAIDERSSAITTYSEEIAGLESKQEESEDQIEALNTKRLHVEAELEKLKSFHYGVRRLPPEILGAIFRICVEKEGGKVIPLSSVAPLLLCRVSSLWRSVAIRTPGLWTCLEIEVNSDISPDGYRNMLSFLLKNGAALPRELQITANYRRAPDSSLAVLSAIHPVLHLVRKLRIYGHGFRPEHFSFLFSLPSGSFPQLERLELRMPTTWKERIDVFSVAPRLREAYLCLHEDMSASYGQIQYTLPWSQLTRLFLYDVIKLPMFGHILRTSTCLRQAIFAVDFEETDGPHTILPVWNDSLVMLCMSVGGEPNSSLDAMLQSLTLPKLEGFQLTLHDHPEVNFTVDFTPHVVECLLGMIPQTSFRRLALGDVRMDAETFIQLLSGMPPTLEKLGLDARYIDVPAILQKLEGESEPCGASETDHSGLILPNLKELMLVFPEQDLSENFDQFREVVDQRKNKLNFASLYVRYPEDYVPKEDDFPCLINNPIDFQLGKGVWVYITGVKDSTFNLSVETDTWYEC